MNWETLYSHYQAQLEDFWGRRDTRPDHVIEFAVFGRPVRMTSNHPGVLEAASFAQPLYSIGPKRNDEPFLIQLVVRTGPVSAGPLPANLFEQSTYTGQGRWQTIHLGAWAYCYIDLEVKEALAVLAPELAEEPAMVSRYLLNTILTNFLIASDYGYLHASALLRGRQALLLMAPHNSGKSTLATRLAMAGYVLLSDSSIFVEKADADLRLYGFPVGQIKLRSDVIDQFPQLQGILEREPVRGELKYSADLRRLDATMVHESVVSPSRLCLCLLSWRGQLETSLRPARAEEVMEAVMANSLFYDTPEVWRRNLSRIQMLVENAQAFHLRAGSDPGGLLAALDALWQ